MSQKKIHPMQVILFEISNFIQFFVRSANDADLGKFQIDRASPLM